MNKLYLLLLCIMHIAFSSCMEWKELTGTPVTKKTKINPLFHNAVSVIPNADIMHQISIITDRFTLQKCSGIPGRNDLVVLINIIDATKKQGVTEDSLGAFTYNQEQKIEIQPFSNHRVRTILFFSCLKKYNITIQEKKEPTCYISTPLPQLFTDTTHIKEKPTGMLCHSHIFNPHDQHHFNNLVKTVNLLHDFNPEYLKELTHHIYSHTNLLGHNFNYIPYTNLTNEFYNTACDLIIGSTSVAKLFYLLHIIETIKLFMPSDAEHQLGYNILVHEPHKLMSPPLHPFWDNNQDLLNIKNRISILCKLIEQYNTKRGHKKTPTDLQHIVYYCKERLNMALPDTFFNITFNEDIYAIKEYIELYTHERILYCAHNDTVQECVHLLFPRQTEDTTTS